MSITSEREEVEEAVDAINAFDEQCAKDEYTDTGEAWQVINEAKAALLTALWRYDLMGWG